MLVVLVLLVLVATSKTQSFALATIDEGNVLSKSAQCVNFCSRYSGSESQFDESASTCTCTLRDPLPDRQSPIDIDTNILKSALLPELKWSRSSCAQPINMTMRTDGHSVFLNVQDSPLPSITGGKLNDTPYNLVNLHFHWSEINDNGSEHSLNGKRYPMEMHVVFSNSKLTPEEALKNPEGAAVIAYFIEINDTETHQHALPLDIIADTLEDIKSRNTSVQLRSLFPFSKLAHIFSTEYVTYEGSLTTPDYNEIVTWFICPHTLHIKSEQLQKFRELRSRGLVDEDANNRGLQPLNDRSIYLARDVGRSATPCKHKIKHNIFKKALFDDYYYNLNSCSKASANKKITMPDKWAYYFNDVVKDIGNSSKPNRYCVHYRGYKLPVIYDFSNAMYRVVKCKH